MNIRNIKEKICHYWVFINEILIKINNYKIINYKKLEPKFFITMLDTHLKSQDAKVS